MNSPPLSVKSSTDHRAELAALLRGQTIVVPDLYSTWPGWKVRQHPDIQRMRGELEAWFKIYIPTANHRARQRKVDSPLCSGGFWTSVTREKFEVLCSLVAWFFFWDDEMDCGELTEDRDKAEAYCDDTVAFIKSCIQPELGIAAPAPGRLHNSGAWAGIGEAMLIGQTLEDRNRFAESILQYVNCVRGQQLQRLEGTSSIEDYIERRVVSVASTPCITVLPWAYDLKLPSWVMEHEALYRICREVAMGVWLVNDIISIKKEIINDEVDSIIPLFVYHEGLTAQQAVDKAVGMISQSYDDFEAAADRLRLAAKAESVQVQSDVDILIGGAMDVLVGNYVWTADSPRYLPKSAFTGHNLSFTVVL